MKVLVLGASGHIGRQLVRELCDTTWAVPTAASRSVQPAPSPIAGSIQLDTTSQAGLAAALEGFDAVVNCVAGSARAISEGARVLASAALAADCKKIVHLSTMSVYGPAEGSVREDAALDPRLGWYGRAKCEAEAHVAKFAQQGGGAVILRPGCVYGPGSELWVGRVGRWLRARRLGDLGMSGDGWSNLVHVDDVCRAVVAALQLPLRPRELKTYNLAAPDSPRWNSYFVDLAMAIGAVPVRRISPGQLKFETLLAAPPLKIAQAVLAPFKGSRVVPDPMPGSLPRLWAQHIKLDPGSATRDLAMAWTPYNSGLQSSANWFLGLHS